MTDLAFASIAELAPRLANKEISPVEVTEAALARLEQLEPRLNAFITVTAESARHAARAAEAAILAGHYLGPLHGIPGRSRTSTRPAASPPRSARRSTRTGCPTSTRPRSSS